MAPAARRDSRQQRSGNAWRQTGRSSCIKPSKVKIRSEFRARRICDARPGWRLDSDRSDSASSRTTMGHFPSDQAGCGAVSASHRTYQGRCRKQAEKVSNSDEVRELALFRRFRSFASCSASLQRWARITHSRLAPHPRPRNAHTRTCARTRTTSEFCVSCVFRSALCRRAPAACPADPMRRSSRGP